MHGLCLLISGGDFSPLPKELYEADYVIACDKGWQYAERLGLSPDLILGDFDSVPPPMTSVPVEHFPTRKDDTDTMLAARRALAMGYRDIAVACAFGGRFDHALANLQTAAFLASHGARTRLVGTDTDALAFAGANADALAFDRTDIDVRTFAGANTDAPAFVRTERFPRRDGWSLSVFALSDICQGVSIRGTEYVCTDETLTNTFPIGISNAWASEEAEISVRSGILLVMHSKLQKGEHI